MKIKTGDEVLVIAGKDKGVRGTVLSVDLEKNKVIVEGVNRMKRHVRQTTTARGAVVGGIETVEAPIHISNVQLLVDGKPTRVGARRDEVTKTRADGTTYESTRGVRVARRTGKDV
ncbi:MAG: 50S ribosomal protein L24 [Actinomycetales bacterium]|nr:50S ribosomal protein L24 [Actinomycetales bacterium]